MPDYLSPLQDVFGTASLGGRYLLVLAVFPLVVWGTGSVRPASTVTVSTGEGAKIATEQGRSRTSSSVLVSATREEYGGRPGSH